MQKWRKLGLILKIDNYSDWAQTHAMMPCVDAIDERFFWIYFSPRDSLNQSRPARVKLDMQEKKVIGNIEGPLLQLGKPGLFDDSGIMPTCIIRNRQELYMFYNGWTLGKKIPFWSFNGVAVSYDKGQSFTKKAKWPIVLSRNEIDPYSTFAPFVLKDENLWRMYYVSCTHWDSSQNQTKHYYHIKYAESKDGNFWERKGWVCIDFKSDREYAIARPVVIKVADQYQMWYSYRETEKAKTYRIGYATSEDGISWIRRDEEIDFHVSRNGWDSDMVCYGYVFRYNQQLYMLYNGNHYGKTGMGLAVLT